MKEKNSLGSWGIFVLLCIIWGSSFILMKWSKDGLTGVQIASLRIFSAGIVFVPFALFYLGKIPRKKIFLSLLSALFGNLLPAYLFAAAIANNVDSSLAGILNSLTPISVVLIGIIFFKSKIKWQQLTGILIGFAGLSLLAFSRKGISLENAEYALWIVLATIFYAVNVNLVSHYLTDVNPVHLGTVSLSFMTIPTAIVLWQQDFLSIDFSEPEIQYAVLSSVILGIAGSAIATVLFYMLVKKSGGLFASLVTYGIPFVALTWGFIYHENITFLQIGCLGIILCGVYLARK